MEEDPFKDLKIADSSFLDGLGGRTSCPKCGRTRKYYCYACYIPMAGVEGHLQKIKLPVKVDIIKHPSEVDGKSTAVHAAILAPEDVTIYTYPVIPDYKNRSKVLLMFPGEKSSSLKDLLEACNKFKTQTSEEEESKKRENDPEEEKPPVKSNTDHPAEESCGNKRLHEGSSEEEPPSKKSHMDSLPFTRVVFIDSTWNQTLKIYKDERLRGLQQVELKSRTTKFWRHQKEKPESYLATIEAIYYFFVDFHELFMSEPDQGKYDNLLFFFAYMYRKIRNIYKGGEQLKAYKKKETTKVQAN